MCIPTYSRLEYLKIAVASLYAQTYKNFEICVSLDPKQTGPDLDIHNWCESQAASNPLFKYRWNNKNLGLAGNWNVLVPFATGKYIMIIGDDDTLEPTFIEKMIEQINKYNPDVIFCDQNFMDENGNLLHELTRKSSVDYQRTNLRLHQ